MQRTLAWDAASRIKAYTHSSSGANAVALNQSFDYDDLDRLTRFTGNGSTQTYTYDANGNCTSAGFGGRGYTNTIAAGSNQLITTTGPVRDKTNTYDPAGNLAKDGTVTYAYTARGRMSSATIVPARISYLYNGLGQRVRQVTGTAVNSAGILVYDESSRMSNTLIGTTKTSYLYGTGQ